MRSLLKVRAASVTIAALKAGYRREPAGDDPAQNRIAWHGEDGTLFLSGNPETMPAPLRFATRALLIAWFAGECRLCGARAQLLTERQLALIDAARLQVVTGHRLRDDHGSAQAEHFAIEHAATCACAAEHVERMAGAANN